MRATVLILAALALACVAGAQSFLDPTATADPREMRVDWTPVGEPILLPSQGLPGSAFYQQIIHVVVTDRGTVIGEERDYPIRWREGTRPEDQERYCQQMADDYCRYVIDETVRPRDGFIAMQNALTDELRVAWEHFIDGVKLLPDPEIPIVTVMWRAAFEPIPWCNERELATAMARAAGCESSEEFFARVVEYREWL